MKKIIRYVGLDVHAETIAVAVARGRTARCGRWARFRIGRRRCGKLVKKLGPSSSCGSATRRGRCGYVLYWQLTELGVQCEVVAPTLVPVKAGDRVKTDRRDAEKLARCYRSGDLTAVWVPDAAHEALRDLVRAREAAKKDSCARGIGWASFCCATAGELPEGMKAWTTRHTGVAADSCSFEHAAQEATLLDYLTEVEHAAAAHRAARAGDRRSGASDAPAADARGDRCAAGAARRREDDGGDDRRRGRQSSRASRGPTSSWATAALVPSEHSSGEQHSTRSDHQDRQRAPAAGAGRSGLGLPASAELCRQLQQAPGGLERGDQGDRLEGAASTAQPLPATASTGQDPAAKRHRRGPRARSASSGPSAVRRERQHDSDEAARASARRTEGVKQSSQRSRGTRKGESSCSPMRQASARTRAPSPRQLPTDHDHDGEPHARSANIRVINRRDKAASTAVPRLHPNSGKMQDITNDKR